MATNIWSSSTLLLRAPLVALAEGLGRLGNNNKHRAVIYRGQNRTGTTRTTGRKKMSMGHIIKEWILEERLFYRKKRDVPKKETVLEKIGMIT